MRRLENIEFIGKYIECQIDLPLAILRIKEDSFKDLIVIEENSKIYEWIDNVNKMKEVKTILIIADEDAFSEKNYHNYLLEIFDKKFNGPNLSMDESKIETSQRAIEINALSNFARHFIKSNKLIISCLSGEVVTPFFGLSLFTDIRFGSEFMVFSLSHVKYGMHPSGLLPFILKKHIGLGRAMKYLISSDKIDAAEALDLGLLSKVFSHANFEKQCIEEAKRISLNSQNVIKSTKELLYNFDKELEDYINNDSRYMYC